jgi:homoserine dehydrogenase
MRIGLLGFGTVGKGVYELTKARADMEVVRVLCRREITLPDAQVTHDFNDILNDTTIDTVVEAIGGLHPAWDYVKAAIKAGKNVVTANKALVATFYDELIPLIEEKGVYFRCTASVGGGIGWLSELERVRRCEGIKQVGGIMNGTCNYILDSMTQWGLSYEAALANAQMLGYAEADPSTDVDGIDTWHKLIVSANIAYGVSLDTSGIPAAGISRITKEDVDNFREHNLVCKLVSFSRKHKNGLYCAWVQPTLFPQGEPEAAVPVNYNHITLAGTISGRQSFFGQGAGRWPTAYNVVQDLVDFLHGNGFYTPYGQKITVKNEDQLRYYVRGAAWPAARTEEYWDDDAVITVPVSVEEMHAWLKNNPGAFIAAMPKKKKKAVFDEEPSLN